MGRPRTTWPAVLCPRLTIGDALRATSREAPSPTLIRARTDSDAMIPMAIMPTVSRERLSAVAVSFRGLDYPYEICSQLIHVRTATDSRGRRRSRFTCPDCQGVADSLYLAPGETMLVCRRCARVSYHWSPARPSGSDPPGWARAVEAALSACAEFRKKVGPVPAPRLRSCSRMESERSRKQVASETQDGLTARQRAVAHLWGWWGWSVAQLAQLFDVSDRTIKRDLRAGRAAGAVPRRARRSASSTLQQAGSLLRACAQLREVVVNAPDRLPTDDASGLWVAALQARLLAEERKLLALIAALPGATRGRLAQESELPEYLDPDLLNAVAELARAG